MPFFQGATDFEINGGSFQDMRDQYNTNRNESFNIHGNNNKTDFAPNYSRTDNRIYDSRSMNMHEFMPPGRNHAVPPQNYAPAMSYEQLYQLQILELQRANLQLQLAASTAASQPHRLGITNISQTPSSQSTGYPQQQHLQNSPQPFLPQIPPPPNLPYFPPLPQISPQPVPAFQQHPPGPGPEIFHGSPQQSSSLDHALPGLGAIGAIQQRFERLAQQAPAAPAQPPKPQSAPPGTTVPSPSPTSTNDPPPTQGMPQGLYQASNVQPSPVFSPMPAPAVGVSQHTTPAVVRPATASSTSSSSSSSSDSTNERAGPVSTVANPPTPPTNTVAAQASPTTNVAVSQQAIPIVAPQPLAGFPPLPTQMIDTAQLSTTQTATAATATPNLPPPSNVPTGPQTPQNTMVAPLMHANFTMAPVPVPTTSPGGAPSTGAISSVTMRPLLSFPIPSTQGSPALGPGASGTGSITPEKKKRQSWLGRKFNFKKSKD